MHGAHLISRFLLPGMAFFLALFISISCIAGESPSGTTRSADDIDGRLEEAVALLNAGLLCHAEEKLTPLMSEQHETGGMAAFLLGRIYGKTGSYEKAVEFLMQASDRYPLIRDYATKALADVYRASENHEKVIETVREISNGLLRKFALQSEIASLIALDRHEDLRGIYSVYTNENPDDWQYRMDFASFLAARGEVGGAIQQYKDIYTGGGRLAEEALNALASLKADIFSTEETLERAENLFAQHRYAEAERVYEDLFSALEGDGKKNVMFAIGMCQFRQKRYGASATSFSFSDAPHWMYWSARSYYRKDNREEFARVRSEFEKRYPDNGQLALLYLMEADEWRRAGNLEMAQKGYEAVASRFPENAEEALWGLGWMHYSAGNFEQSLEVFSRLAGLGESRDYQKYLYWKARSQEMMSRACRSAGDNRHEGNDSACHSGETDFFEQLPSDRSYYGYMIKMRSPLDEKAERMYPSASLLPEGEQFRRIHALAVMGMRDEAVLEIADAIQKAASPEELCYLVQAAMKLDAYKDVISIAEPRGEEWFLPYSYPRAYWGTIKYAAEAVGVDEHLVAALIREESRYDPEVVSWAGAVGLMQLLPSTAKRMNMGAAVHTGGSLDLADVRTNIVLGTHYLGRLVHEFREIPFAVAAYNAGENRLRSWLDKYYRQDMDEFIENIPYKETRNYVKKVLKSYWLYRELSGLPVEEIGGQPPNIRDFEPGLAKLTPPHPSAASVP